MIQRMNIAFQGGPLDGQILAVQRDIWEYEAQVVDLSERNNPSVQTHPLRYRRTDRRLVQGLIDAAVFEPMTEAPTMIPISDLRDPSDPQGRSYREVNAAKTHKYPVNANHDLRFT
jgi:hypothetical protein